LGQPKNDNNNQLIQLTDIFCVLLRYNGTSINWLQYAADSIISDPIKRRPLYFIPSTKHFDFFVESTYHLRIQKSKIYTFESWDFSIPLVFLRMYANFNVTFLSLSLSLSINFTFFSVLGISYFLFIVYHFIQTVQFLVFISPFFNYLASLYEVSCTFLYIAI